MITITNLLTNESFQGSAHRIAPDRLTSGDDLFENLSVDGVFIPTESETPFRNKMYHGVVYSIKNDATNECYFGYPLIASKNESPNYWRLSFFIIHDNLNVVKAMDESVQNLIDKP